VPVKRDGVDRPGTSAGQQSAMNLGEASALHLGTAVAPSRSMKSWTRAVDGGQRWLLAVATCTIGCGATSVPIGEPLAAGPWPPETQCEEESFLALRTTDVYASASRETPLGFGSSLETSVEKAQRGVGLYRFLSDEPEELPDALDSLGEPSLARRHRDRMAPTARRNRTRVNAMATLFTLGIASVGGGLGLALGAPRDPNGDIRPEFGWSGLAVVGTGLILTLSGTIVGIATKPSPFEQADHDVRARILVPAEDDLVAASRGVARHNERARATCRP